MNKTILKWAGNKSKVMSSIQEYFPSVDEISCYCEPFAGALGSYVNSSFTNKENVFLNDVNNEIINLYKVLRETPDKLIALANSYKKDKETYYKIREWDRSPTWINDTNLKKASRTVYLNKLCFNGLYRVNKNTGYFNVPYASERKSPVLPSDVVTSFNEKIKNVNFSSLDYEDICMKVLDKDLGKTLFYFDPPYVDVKDPTKDFQGYMSNFTFKDQERLVELAKLIKNSGHYVVLSNSFCDTTLELYKDFTVKEIEVRRNISAKASSRGIVKEIVAY
jgi:DNA adenine methylase